MPHTAGVEKQLILSGCRLVRVQTCAKGGCPDAWQPNRGISFKFAVYVYRRCGK
ncbi:MAG: hypothetical protein RSD35_04345 [Oscillospiraceae bacterium]